MFRALRHVFTPYWILKLRFGTQLLERIERRIGEVERAHPGELRFVVEHALELGDLLQRVTPRQRALELFGLLGVWDTEYNNGVLIYVLYAEHAVEIVVDRGLAGKVPQSEWDTLCRATEEHFRNGRFVDGSLTAVDGAARLLEKHFPARPPGSNELPDQPLLL